MADSQRRGDRDGPQHVRRVKMSHHHPIANIGPRRLARQRKRQSLGGGVSLLLGDDQRSAIDERDEPQSDRNGRVFTPYRFVHDIGEGYRRSWGASAVPMAVLVDRDGKVAWASNGVGANFSDTLHSQLDNPELLLKIQGSDEH